MRRALPAVAGATLALGAVAASVAVLVVLRGSEPARPAAAPGPDVVAPLTARAAAPPSGPEPRTAPPAPSQPPVLAPAPTTTPPARPALTVVNNSRIPQLGQRAAARYRAAGWPVAAVGSVRGRIRATTVYYDAGQRAQAQAAAQALGIPRVLPRLPNLPGSGLTVVVTRDAA